VIKLVDILNEYSHNNGSTGGSDAGEPETGFTNPRRKRKLGVDSSKPEPWFEKGGYTQLEFPRADNPYGRIGRGDDKSIQRVQVIKKVINTGLKYEDFYDTIASWDKFGSQDYSTDFEQEKTK
tara:strand:+ start:256 stop:624 length:369 start_codon:yes stop_codon:yes gene_type:complete